ncbi:carboxypeptidase-like regulatory domain-containing protein [Schlesneria sp. DSM 10557]|uniref:carboxypeptidase-like regulatory domain-containing protein n=1 Tax=Schlesneria sp. DSM 10557 TaxID=3044399 RepID=UPI00359F9FC2
MTVGRSLLLIWLCLVSFSGCGSNQPKAETLVPASGTVKVNGRPAEGVRITFHPTDDTKAQGGCWAMTDAEGKFTVTHLSNKPGIPAGNYFVTFSQFVKPDGKPLAANESPTMTPSTQAIAARWSDVGKAGMHNKTTIPDKGTTSLDFIISTSAKK